MKDEDDAFNMLKHGQPDAPDSLFAIEAAVILSIVVGLMSYFMTR